ncbi:MAG TPA: lytic transglycosylase domain-containing protein [Terriglobia bacterium]|nr:lytic transglycosylase domain-containing protein [Terriglobia bacterium]
MALSIQQQIVNEANAQGVPSNYMLAIANQESGFNQAAVGSSGEIGVFQLMPGTAASLGVTNPADLSQNIYGGVAYFKQMLNQFGGNPALAAAAYNAGPGAVSSGNIPSSTQSYVSRFLAAVGLSPSPAAGTSAGVSIPAPIESASLLGPGIIIPGLSAPVSGISSGIWIAAGAALLLLLFA